MSRGPIQVVLLDLDGTLLDTAPDLIDTTQVLLARHQRPPIHPGHLRPVVSHGSAAILARAFNLALNDPAMEPLREEFLAEYRDRVSRCTRPFAGMPELLADLERMGLRWGVVTNKPAWLTLPLLDDLDLLDRCACVVCGDTVPGRKKPHPDPIRHACELLGIHPSQAVLVGDARRDVTAAQDAGSRSVIALFGYLCAEDQPGRWGADACIEQPMHLLDWLRGLAQVEPQRRAAPALS